MKIVTYSVKRCLSYFAVGPKKKVLESCAIAAYHQSTDIPVVITLLSDDARQFRQIAYHHALCWIHDGRNYKKLRPIVPYLYLFRVREVHLQSPYQVNL